MVNKTVLERKMNVVEAIRTRRSIRKFTGAPVGEELISEFLKSAMAAPSSKNEQPWVFVVINDRKTLDEIPKFHPYAEMIKSATVAILVCADKRRFLSEEVWIQDCSAATQNILLAAHGMGLGAVWLGIYPRGERMEGMIGLLGLPEPIIPFSLVVLGYPAEQKPPANRFDPSRVHRGKW
jgi:nitroreductase